MTTPGRGLSRPRDARLWDSDGNLITVLRGYRGVAIHAAFSPDGTCVATVSTDGNVRLYPVRATQALIDHARRVVPRQLTSEQRTRFFLNADP